MISDRAKDSFDRIFRRAAQSRLPLNSADGCDIVPNRQVGKEAPSGSKAVVLTISSLRFRVLLILHFDEDEASRDYFVKDGAETSFEEAFQEVANLCCGAMNQELLHYFPDLGMSTPYVLNARCVPYLEELKPGYLASYAITVGGSVRLGATVCVCAYAPVDFAADVNVVEETSGELELF